MKQISCWSLIFIMIFIIILHVILKEKIFEGMMQQQGQPEDLDLESNTETTVMFSQGASSAKSELDIIDEEAADPALAADPEVAAVPTPVPTPTPTPAPVAAELIDCAGSWGDWSECSKTCGGGTKSREYSVNTPAENGGRECPKEDGENENESCNTQGCPVDCVGSWGDWSECSKKYGIGEKFKEYTITTPVANGGQACPHPDHHVETTICKDNDASTNWIKKTTQNAANVVSIASYNQKRYQADQRALRGSKSLYGVNSDDKIYYSPSTDGNWQNIPGGLKQVDIDGTTVCGVNSSDKIYCKDNLTGSNWKNLPGKLKYVSVNG